jgi:hypothetical protein
MVGFLMSKTGRLGLYERSKFREILGRWADRIGKKEQSR